MTNIVTVIKPRPKWHLIDFSEIWKFRELFYIFTWRDLKVRYKQTALGFLWAIFQPLSQTFIFTIFFGNLAKIPSGELPYPLFVLIGLVFWTFFAGALTNASNSLVTNEAIIRKIYFPRLILPLSSILTSFVDFTITSILLLGFLIYYGFSPSLNVLWIVPLGILISSLAAAGGGFFLSAINIKYRDVRVILPFFIQTLIFLSPVIYPTNIVRPSNRILMALNPMTGVIEAARSAISGTGVINWETFGISALAAIFIFLVGLYYFKATERFFADIV